MVLHKLNNRYRCGECGVVFCGSCREHPYHLGISCAAHAVRLAAPKCRFCGERVEWGGMDLDWNEEAGEEEERGDGVGEGRKKDGEDAAKRLAELVAFHGDTITSSNSGGGGGSSGQAPQDTSNWSWNEGEMRELLAAVGVDTSWCVSKADLAAVAAAAVCVCGEEQCRERLRDACTRVGPCGHACGGVRGEVDCLPCLHDACVEERDAAAAAAPSAAAATAASGSGAGAFGGAAAPGSVAAAAAAAAAAAPCPMPPLPCASDFCPICWVEPIAAAPAIRLLSCGHVVHAACAREKICQSFPGPEISFGFLSCPLCPDTTMDHPALQTELAAPLALKQQVERLAEERVKAGEGLGDGEEENGNGGLGNNVLARALRRLLFFLCSRCHRPYFGGDRRCGAGPAAAEPENVDGEEGEGEEMEEGEREGGGVERAGEVGGQGQRENELVCGECLAVEAAAKQKAAAEAAAAAAAAAEEERERRERLWEAGKPCSSNHGKEAVQYKCQFCCSVATYFCNGTTHYCAECHQTLPNYRSSSYVAPRCTGGDQCPLRVAWHPQAPEEFCLGSTFVPSAGWSRLLPPVPSACCPAATWSTQQVEGLAEERVKAREGLGDVEEEDGDGEEEDGDGEEEDGDGEEEDGDGEEANGNYGLGNGLLEVALHRLLFFLCSCCHRP
ncbi:unnamed protein product [Closterium sp. NIES-65]|nr:unnamed protein product [Closterium sp. NIES-65]